MLLVTAVSISPWSPIVPALRPLDVIKTLFRIRIVNQQNVPFHGGALLVSNHMSHIDGFLIGACVQRVIRFMVWKPYFEAKALNWFLRRMHAIPVAETPRDAVEVDPRRRARSSPKATWSASSPKAPISRTGNMLPFKRGLEKIVDGSDVPIVPVHLDRLWGSIFSFEGGHFFRKWPKRIPYPVTVSFGAPMPPDTPSHEVRQAILELGADAVPLRQTPADTLDQRFIRTARRNWNAFAMPDYTYGRALTAALLLGSGDSRRADDRRPASGERRRSARESGGDSRRTRSRST